MKKLKRQGIITARGFTLLELLVTVSILMILATIAIPSFSGWRTAMQSKAIQQELGSAVALARSYAVENSQYMVLCQLDEYGICSDNFAPPLTLFHNADENRVLDEEGQIIKVFTMQIPASAKLSWSNNGYIAYWAGGATSGKITYCHSHSLNYSFEIIIARTGRARVNKDDIIC